MRRFELQIAKKELKIEKKLNTIDEKWTSLVLDYIQHKETDMRVVKPSDELIEALEEHQLELQGMIGMGKFVEYFKDRVLRWQTALGTVETVLKEWTSVTKSWASLEAIFLGSADIRAQLPDDTKVFSLPYVVARLSYRCAAFRGNRPGIQGADEGRYPRTKCGRGVLRRGPRGFAQEHDQEPGVVPEVAQ